MTKSASQTKQDNTIELIIFLLLKVENKQENVFGKVEQLLYTPIKAYFTAVLQGNVTGVRSGQH